MDDDLDGMAADEFLSYVSIAREFARRVPRDVWDRIRELPPEEAEQEFIRWVAALESTGDDSE